MDCSLFQKVAFIGILRREETANYCLGFKTSKTARPFFN